ncbi:pickpocket protein 28-like [Macrosteles quadrilineatus]|uniref:pickpocket protein 28-like n=1 Tax=Macrosteles quadrilineatus TaxID=74068 RepID=UPI0023E2ED38|nr:pickpocket protein 28-like [Macrosteles quadrilineatus]
MESSSVHCLRYLIHPECPPIHRFGWGIVFLLTVVGAVISITGSYFSFVESPVVMTVDTSSYHMSNIPFPAVTVCNVNKMKRSSVLQLARIISECGEMTPQEVFDSMGTLGNLFDNQYNRRTDTRWMHKLLVDAGMEDQVRAILEELAPSCDEMLKACSWMGASVPCSSYFTPLLTVENGFCCVFNFNMSFENLLPEYFNDTEEINNEPPITHHMTLGVMQGLSVYLDLGIDEYYFTSLPTFAAKVIVSSSQSFQDSLNGDTIETLVPLGTEVYMRLEADSTFADQDVMEWPFEKRKCHFHHEKKDHFKGFYTFPSCLVFGRAIRSETAGLINVIVGRPVIKIGTPCEHGSPN